LVKKTGQGRRIWGRRKIMKVKESMTYGCVICRRNDIVHTRIVLVRKYQEDKGWIKPNVLKFSYKGESISGGRLLKNRPYIKWPLERWEKVVGKAWPHLTNEEIENRIRRFLESANTANNDKPLGGICKECLRKKDVQILAKGGHIKFI
jgi:hypothetical protein